MPPSHARGLLPPVLSDIFVEKATLARTGLTRNFGKFPFFRTATHAPKIVRRCVPI